MISFARQALKYFKAILSGAPRIQLVIACVAFIGLSPLSMRSALAGTPWEAQVGGFVYVTMDVFVRGEFAGQPPTNQVHRNSRRVCTSEDFLRLASETVTRERFLEFDRECESVEVKHQRRIVTGTVYLPTGHCETIQREYLRMLDDHVYSYASDTPDMNIKYKGADVQTSRRDLARSLKITTTCNGDGSFSVSARRKRD